MPDAIHRALLESLLNTLAFLDLSDDETVDPDDAVRAQEDAAQPLLQLSVPDRAALVAMIEEYGEEQESGDFRDFVLATPEAIGLTDDED